VKGVTGGLLIKLIPLSSGRQVTLGVDLTILGEETPPAAGEPTICHGGESVRVGRDGGKGWD
jgi:hypothetical protein